ncbi:MAG: FecR family protein [Burkholderiales bacterium]|nr:FecR family protein [Burkholderiales bacterium]
MQLTGEMTMRNPALILAGLLLLAAGTLSGAVQAANTVGKITHLSGTLVAKRADGTTKLYSVKSEVQEGDTLSTERDTYARIKFADGGEVVLRPGSQLKVAAYSFKQDKPKEDNIFLSILKGGMRAVTGLIGKRNREAVTFGTVTATIGIRGTHFGALICQNDCGGIPTVSGKAPENGLHLDVAAGAIVVKNAAGEQVINAGQFGFVQNANTVPAIVPPSEGVQVTMPSSISQNKSSGRGVGSSSDNECAVQ